MLKLTTGSQRFSSKMSFEDTAAEHWNKQSSINGLPTFTIQPLESIARPIWSSRQSNRRQHFPRNLRANRYDLVISILSIVRFQNIRILSKDLQQKGQLKAIQITRDTIRGAKTSQLTCFKVKLSKTLSFYFISRFKALKVL